MNDTLTLMLLDGQRIERVDDVSSLVAADASGEFGVQPGHAGLITVLEPGLFRWRARSHPAWTHGACLGGLLRCLREGGRTEVRIVSGRFLRADEPEALVAQLDDLLQREGALRVSTRESTLRLDLALMRRLQELARGGR